MTPLQKRNEELRKVLTEAGNKLISPPSTHEELMSLFDLLERNLKKVEQSPSNPMREALGPVLKALMANKLFKHSHIDVRVAAACCISEITRITAPDAPYEDDDLMKEALELIVSSFENLDDNLSQSFSRRVSILDTVAKVRSCLLMLDLECDELVLDIFQFFLKAIRDYHPDNVFSSMKGIMILLLEESEYIPSEILFSLLSFLKNGEREVEAVARKLAEEVLQACAAKIRPFLLQAMKSYGISVTDYCDVVATACPELMTSVDPDDDHTPGENNVAPELMSSKQPGPESGDKVADVISNNDMENPGDDAPEDSISSKKVEFEGGQAIKTTTPPSVQELSGTEDASINNSSGRGGKRKRRKSLFSRRTAARAKMSHVGTPKSDAPDDRNNSIRLPDAACPDFSIAVEVQQETQDIAQQPLLHKDNKVDVNISSSSFANPADAVLGKHDDGNNSNEAALLAPPSSENGVKRRGRKSSSSKKNVGARASNADVRSARKFPNPGGTSKDISSSNYEHLHTETALGLGGQKEIHPDQSPRVLQIEYPSLTSQPVPFDGILKKAKIKRPRKETSKKSSPLSINTTPDKTSNEMTNSSKLIKRSRKMEPQKIIPDNKAEMATSTSEGHPTASRFHLPLEEPSDKLEKNDHALDQTFRRQDICASATSDYVEQKVSSKDKEEASFLGSHFKPSDNTGHLKSSEVDTKKAATTKRKEQNTIEPDDKLVGSKIGVWWPMDNVYYKGVVTWYNPLERKHKILYEDGDEERLDLRIEKWKLWDGSDGAGEAICSDHDGIKIDESASEKSRSMTPKSRWKHKVDNAHDKIEQHKGAKAVSEEQIDKINGQSGHDENVADVNKTKDGTLAIASSKFKDLGNVDLPRTSRNDTPSTGVDGKHKSSLREANAGDVPTSSFRRKTQASISRLGSSAGNMDDSNLSRPQTSKENAGSLLSHGTKSTKRSDVGTTSDESNTTVSDHDRMADGCAYPVCTRSNLGSGDHVFCQDDASALVRCGIDAANTEAQFPRAVSENANTISAAALQTPTMTEMGRPATCSGSSQSDGYREFMGYHVCSHLYPYLERLQKRVGSIWGSVGFKGMIMRSHLLNGLGEVLMVADRPWGSLSHKDLVHVATGIEDALGLGFPVDFLKPIADEARRRMNTFEAKAEVAAIEKQMQDLRSRLETLQQTLGSVEQRLVVDNNTALGDMGTK